VGFSSLCAGLSFGWFWLQQIEKEFLNRRGAEYRGREETGFDAKKVKLNLIQSSNIKEEADGSFTVHLKSPPVDGKANEELINWQKGLSCLNQKSELSPVCCPKS